MNKAKVLSNFLWRLAERCGAQLVTFIVSVVLARLLDPSVYGGIALVTVFITILNVFVDSGLGNALIQKKEADDLDFSSVFYFNICMCTLLYLLVCLLAPCLAAFYKRPELTPVIRVLSLTLVVSGLKNVQQAYVSRTMQFKRFFFSTLAGTLGAACLGIAMAMKGFGIWALVGQQLFNVTLDTIVLWITVKWRPKVAFSLERLKGLFSFGWKLLISGLLETAYNSLRQLLIGKIYSPSDLAYFNRGQQFPQLVIVNVNSSIDSVLLPAMSREQDNIQRVKLMTRRAIKTSIYIIAPLMAGLMACAVPLIRLMLTEKWLPSVFFMRVFCVLFAFFPIHTANLNAIKSLGRSDVFLKLEFAKKFTGLTILVISMRFGLYWMTLSLILETVMGLLINTWPNKKLLDYSFMQQMMDIFPTVLLAAVMGGLVYMIQFLGLPDLVIMLLQVPAGVAIYLAGSLLFRFESFRYLLDTVKSLMKRKKGGN